MNILYDRGRNLSREFQQGFRGISHKRRPSDTELFEAINLSAKEYPTLTTRRERGYITDIGRCLSPSLCAIGYDKIAYLVRGETAEYLCINGVKKYTFATNVDTPRKLVRMGAYICVFPDGIVYNTETDTFKPINITWKNYSTPLIFSPCKMDGQLAGITEIEPSTADIGDVYYNPKENKTYLCSSVYSAWSKEEAVVYTNQMDLAFATTRPPYAVYVSALNGGVATSEEGTLKVFNGGTYIDAESIDIVSELPATPSDGQFVLLKDPTARKNHLYQYRENHPKWVAFPTSYTRIESQNNSAEFAKNFSAGDVVEVTDCGYTRVQTVYVSDDETTGYIVVDHLDITGTFSRSDKAITISRKMPEGLTNVIECANRLWGTDSEGHEIYASKLGDPFNWRAYTGIASDSYAITVGSSGKFTGAISYDGYPHFFKENSILKVYGNHPFRLFALDCPSVAVGNENSVSVLRGAIVYKSVDGFYAYDGGYPTCISESIEDVCGPDYTVSASAADSSAYYAAISKGTNNRIYVYEKGLWHMHNAPDAPEGYNGVIDMLFTGRDIIAAFSASDANLGFTTFPHPSAYLVSLYGREYNWRTNTGQLQLAKSFPVKYTFCNTESSSSLGFKVSASYDSFSALTEGEAFYLNNREYTVKGLHEDTVDGFVIIDVGEISDEALQEGTKYTLCQYIHETTKWGFVTPMLGLSIPDDKSYSHIILRYTAENPISATVIYDEDANKQTTLPARRKLGSGVIYIRPTRSEYIRLRIEGEGHFELFSIARNIEGGNTP